MSGKCPEFVPEKIEKIKGGLKMGPEMDGVGWGEPTEVPGVPGGLLVCPGAPGRLKREVRGGCPHYQELLANYENYEI